jgi:hypothetical protein
LCPWDVVLNVEKLVGCDLGLHEQLVLVAVIVGVPVGIIIDVTSSVDLCKEFL